MADAFQPRYLFAEELKEWGLPDKDEQPNILALVDAASTIIDEHCGRIDGDGNGSLVFTSYTERVLMPVGRNIFRTMFTPLAAIPASVKTSLAASGTYFDTGFVANEFFRSDNVTLSPIVSASGRYGYARRGQQQVYPDLNYGANILQIASFFGGPPNFTNIDIKDIDFDRRTGECWVPAGLYLGQYTEVLLTYNSGFDPRSMPRAIKHACAQLTRNALARGGGTTGLKALRSGAVGGDFHDELVDPTVKRMLQPYTSVIAY